MSLFYQYQSAGVGISKNAPKKKPFFAFLDIFVAKFWNLITVNLINTLFCIPLFLAIACFLVLDNTNLSYPLCVILLLMQATFIGPSTAAMVRVLRNFTIGRPTFLWTEYIATFRKNFKSAAVLGLIDTVLAVGVCAGVYVYPNLIASSENQLLYIPFVLMFSAAIAKILMSFYSYLMLVSTNVSFGGIIRNSLALTFLSFKKNILTLLVIVLTGGLFAFLVYLNFYTLFLLPFVPVSQLWLVVCFNCYPVVQKFVINPYYEQRGEVNPELDADASDETVFADRGGEEKPVEAPKKQARKGKIIS